MAEEMIKLTPQQFQAYFNAMKDELKQETKDAVGPLMIELETLKHTNGVNAKKEDIDSLTKKIGELVANDVQMMENQKKNQEILDNIQAESQKNKIERKDFGSSWQEAIAKEFESKQAEIKNFQTDRTAKLSFELKVGNMLIANVSGDPVQAYNSRQGMVPNQKQNLRDILPTTPSPTGSFVTYRETGTSGSISTQTEGQSKSQIDYSWTEEKKVSVYISGFAVFSKHLMYALPFMNTQLPRQLLRDFYKKENDYFYSAMQSAAQGDASTTGAANSMEQILQLIANQEDANFTASYILGKSQLWAKLIATSKGTGYGVPGGVQFDPQGRTIVAGVPYVKASFADPDSILIWDNDELERVETESLRVEFSYEDNDNFRKNLVTARVECFEELNVLKQDAIIDTTTS